MDFFLEPRALAYSVGLCKGLSNLPHLHRHMEIVYMRKGTSWVINFSVLLTRGFASRG